MEKNAQKNELNAKREQILPFMYSIFNLISHFIFMMNNKKCADVFFSVQISLKSVKCVRQMRGKGLSVSFVHFESVFHLIIQTKI